jgi:hypothetical protein
LDCLADISNVDELAGLAYLEEFAFGVFESNLPDLLNMASLSQVRRLILAESRRNNIDLAPLSAFQQLETLFLSSHARNIESIGRIHSIRKLSLSGMKNKQRLSFVQTMKGLVSLTLLLGGRANLEEIAHSGINHLEILRVRGLEEVDLSLFPRLGKLRIEDQIRLSSLNLKFRPPMRWLSIWNCKTLSKIYGINAIDGLEYLFAGKTAFDPDTLLDELPKSLKYVSLTGYGKYRDDKLKQLIESRGYIPSIYLRGIDSI